MGELAIIFRRERVKPLSKLVPRLQYGIKAELVELVSLRGVGRVRARNLHTAGYTTLKKLQLTRAADLAKSRPSRNPSRSRSRSNSGRR